MQTKKGVSQKELEREIDEIEDEFGSPIDDEITIKASKPIAKIKKGDKMKVDGMEFEVDAHYVLIDHKSTKEMAIEIFNKNDKDYQLRYFNDKPDKTMEFYELQEILYVKKPVKKIEW